MWAVYEREIKSKGNREWNREWNRAWDWNKKRSTLGVPE